MLVVGRVYGVVKPVELVLLVGWNAHPTDLEDRSHRALGHLKRDLQREDLLVAVGDTVVTSGFSDIYPAGLRVGIVTYVNEKPEHFFKEIKVEPSASMSKLKIVFLLVDAIEPQTDEFSDTK